VLIAADKHITLLCGGAYIKMADGNIELGMPGTFTVKAAQHNFSGPNSASVAFNSWDATPFDDRFQATLSDGSPARNREYTLIRRDGGRITGTTDAEGFLSLQQDMRMVGVLIEWSHDER